MPDFFVNSSDRLLITGAAGFIGRRVVANLLGKGFTNIACLVRPSRGRTPARDLFGEMPDGARPEVFHGNLLSRADCRTIVSGARVVIHLAAGLGEKSYADAFLNSVVTTRNLLDACVSEPLLRRFVNISSFAVYSNLNNPHGRLLDEDAPIDANPVARGNAYCYAKVRQDEMVIDYGRKHALPYVILRPGVVYGPGNDAIHTRVGLGTFGVFLHCGGANRLPLTYVDNCAEAIVLAATTSGVDGEVFNVVDDDLPTSRAFLRQYKRRVRRFFSIRVPHGLSYLCCLLWEKYSKWSNGQLPPVFNRSAWRANWKRTKYTNQRLKTGLGWSQRIPTGEALRLYFESCQKKKSHA